MVQACDYCAVYNALASTQGVQGSLNTGIAHKFTHYESNVKEISLQDLPSQKLESNIAQFFFDYNLTDRFLLQTNIPLIYRSYRRIVAEEVERGSVSGLGDIALLAKYDLFRENSAESSILLEVLGGVKFPTGSTDRLEGGQVAQLEGDPDLHKLSFYRHGSEEEPLVANDDLALGSGSVDFILGTSLFVRYARAYVSGVVQYAIRQEGDFGFRYGNSFDSDFGPGYYLVLNDRNSLALRMRVSVETKEIDKVYGLTQANSDFTRVFLGPELNYTFRNNWQVGFANDFALAAEKASASVVPRYRVLAVVSHRFDLII